MLETLASLVGQTKLVRSECSLSIVIHCNILLRSLFYNRGLLYIRTVLTLHLLHEPFVLFLLLQVTLSLVLDLQTGNHD